MSGEFISEDELLTFEGWSKYQGADLATMPPEELKRWKEIFDEVMRLQETQPESRADETAARSRRGEVRRRDPRRNGTLAYDVGSLLTQGGDIYHVPARRS